MKPLKLQTQIMLFVIFGIPTAIGLGQGCVHGQANSPCPGLWCISVTELPGPKLCYDTEAQMLAGKAQYEAKGMHASLVTK